MTCWLTAAEHIHLVKYLDFPGYRVPGSTSQIRIHGARVGLMEEQVHMIWTCRKLDTLCFSGVTDFQSSIDKLPDQPVCRQPTARPPPSVQSASRGIAEPFHAFQGWSFAFVRKPVQTLEVH